MAGVHTTLWFTEGGWSKARSALTRLQNHLQQVGSTASLSVTPKSIAHVEVREGKTYRAPRWEVFLEWHLPQDYTLAGELRKEGDEWLLQEGLHLKTPWLGPEPSACTHCGKKGRKYFPSYFADFPSYFAVSHTSRGIYHEKCLEAAFGKHSAEASISWVHSWDPLSKHGVAQHAPLQPGEGVAVYTQQEAAAVASHYIGKHGFERTLQHPSTKSRMVEALGLPGANYTSLLQEAQAKVSPTLAKDALAFFEAMPNPSDWAFKCRQILAKPHLLGEDLGLHASAIKVFEERAAQEALEAAQNFRKGHFAAVGANLVAAVAWVVQVRPFTYFGQEVQEVVLRDAYGIKLLAHLKPGEEVPAVGEEIVFDAKVSRHEHFRGVDATVLTYFAWTKALLW